MSSPKDLSDLAAYVSDDSDIEIDEPIHAKPKATYSVRLRLNGYALGTHAAPRETVTISAKDYALILVLIELMENATFLELHHGRIIYTNSQLKPIRDRCREIVERD